MRRAILAVSLIGILAGCALGQDLYDERRIDECRELPTPDERLTCERNARDEAAGIPLSR